MCVTSIWVTFGLTTECYYVNDIWIESIYSSLWNKIYKIQNTEIIKNMKTEKTFTLVINLWCKLFSKNFPNTTKNLIILLKPFICRAICQFNLDKFICYIKVPKNMECYSPARLYSHWTDICAVTVVARNFLKIIFSN